jgi:RHS repeat-associated protein
MGGGIGSILYSDRSRSGGPVETFTYSPAVGHTVALTSSVGAVLKTDRYAAFGATESSTGASANNRLANTKERSASIGLDNHGFRYYDPVIGRYISRDPIGYMDGPNVYAHVRSNPINRYDPLGLEENGDPPEPPKPPKVDPKAEDAPKAEEPKAPKPKNEEARPPEKKSPEGTSGAPKKGTIEWQLETENLRNGVPNPKGPGNPAKLAAVSTERLVEFLKGTEETQHLAKDMDHLKQTAERIDRVRAELKARGIDPPRAMPRIMGKGGRPPAGGMRIGVPLLLLGEELERRITETSREMTEEEAEASQRNREKGVTDIKRPPGET